MSQNLAGVGVRPWRAILQTAGARCLLVAALYFALALLGLQSSLPGGIAATIWPAAGFALGALLVWGPRCAAGVYLGALGKDLWLGVSLGGALMSALGPLLQALAGYWLTRGLLARQYPLQERRDILRFLALAGPLSCLVSASLAAAVLSIDGLLPAQQLAGHWFTWWSGDVLGVALFAPLTLLLLPGGRPLRTASRTAIALPLLLAAAALAPMHVAYDLYDKERVRHEIEESLEHVFDKYVPGLYRDLAALESVERFIVASEAVTRDEFAEFTRPILRRPEVLAVEWLPRVRHAERAAFEQTLAGKGRGRVEISEGEANGGRARAGQRSDYFPVALVEPRAAGGPNLGVDRWAEPRHQAAMVRAADLGGMIASVPVHMPRDGRQGIAVFMPAFRRGFDPAVGSEADRREALRGFAAVVFDRERLFASLGIDAKKQNLYFRVTDLGLTGPDAVLGGNWPPTLATAAGADWQRELELAGRRWRLEMRPAIPLQQLAGGHAGKLLDTLLVLAALLVSFGVLSGNGRAAVLAASESRYRSLTQNLNGMVYRCRNDPDWTIEFASKGCSELLGLEPEDLVAGRPTYGSLIHPEDGGRVWDGVQAALAQRLPWRIEYRVRHADGGWRWVWEQGVGVWDSEGELSHLEGFIADIDTRKRAVQELIAARRFLNATLDALTAHIAIVDGAGRIIATNRAWRDFAAANGGGNNPALGVGVNYLAVCEAAAATGDADAARLLRGLRAVAKGEAEYWNLEYTCHAPDEQRWFYCRITRQGGELAEHLVIAHENITAIHRARDALGESEKRLRTLLDAIPDAIWLKDAEGTYLDCNPAFERQIGAGKVDIVGRDDRDLMVPELADRLRQQARQAMAGGRPVCDRHWIRSRADGRRHLIETVKTPLSGPDGALLGVIGIGRDITARHAVEAALQALNSVETGAPFFERICRTLAELTASEIVFVGVLRDPAQMRTVALIVDGEALPEVDYALAGTPCETVAGKSVCVIADRVRQRFPADVMLAGLGAVSYAGAPLFDSQQRPLGVIGVVGRQPITEPDSLTTLLQLSALRVGAELERARDTARLRASEEKFRRLVESIGADYFFYQRGCDGIFSYVGPSVMNILGYAPEEFRVHFTTYLADPPGQPGVVAQAEASLRGEDQPPYLVEMAHKDGRRVTLEVSEVALRDASGAIVGVEGIAHDVTLRQAAEQALREAAVELERRVEERTHDLAVANAALIRSELATRSLVDNLVDCVISIDENGIIQSANRAVERILGYGAADLVGHNVSLLLMPADGAHHDKHIERYRRGGEARIIGVGRQVDGRHKDGSPIAMELSVGEYFVDGRRYFTGILRDVRDRLRVVQELERARHDAEQASLAKSAFLAAMSHEIRTPMNGVIGMVDVLHQTSLKGYQVEIVDTIRDSAYSLLGIIEDILDFSKIEAGRLELEREPMSVSAVLAQVCKMLDHLAARKGVELTLFVDPLLSVQVLGDALRLRQVLVNLTNNAIKFSSGMQLPGKVSLRARLTARDAEGLSVEFEVTDNGIGMDEATQARLFNSFTQADASTTRRFGGTGLGLAIAGNLVQLMGGKIAVRSAPGAGSSFIAQIPFVALPDSPAEGATALAGLRCLVVGASPGVADDLGAYLAHSGAAVKRAPDLIQARRQPGTPGLTVWIIDAADAAAANDDLLQAAAARPDQDLRFVLIGRGQRRTPRTLAGGWVVVDANVLEPRTFLDAVAMAAGRPVAEATGESATAAAYRSDAAGSQAADESARRSARDVARRQGRLILVAEDNETNQKVILRQLALLGYAADVVGNGREALEYWKRGDYGLLLTDLHMPQMDGYELSLAIRAAETGDRLPIVALTANALKDEANRCRAVGMDDYLSKPVQLEKLGAVLDRWLAAAGPVAVSSAPTPAVLDVGVLGALVGDDPAVIHELLLEFRASATSIAAELSAACADGHAEAAGRAAHKLKSAARATGALRLGDICAAIEQAGRSGDRDLLAGLLTEFEGEMAAVKAFLDDLPKE
ncbi:MAG: PAS domain S-box protein [Rhodocyclales bacterium]|nr:PAS domain S-box protein [Rhodocyclales bacterium]